MPISSNGRKAGPFAGNGITTLFPFAFKVFGEGDVLVISADSLGTESILVLTTDYTVSLNSDQDVNPGGSITKVVALPLASTVVITSNIQELQPIDITNQGGFYPSVMNKALDRLTIIAQQLRLDVDRSAKLPITRTEDADSLLADVVLVADNISTVQAVGGSIGSVNAVAPIVANVTTVAGIAASVPVVAGIGAEVAQVAAIQASVTTVAGIGPSVTAVAGNAANITSVASINAAVSTAAANMAAIVAAPTHATTASTQAGIATTQAGISTAKAVISTDQAAISTTKASESSVSAALSAANADAARSQNILINGRMWNVPDAASSWTNPATATYMMGLWYLIRAGTFAFDAAKVATGPTDCPDALQFTCTTAQASFGSSDVLSSEEGVEALNCTPLIGKTFTVRGSVYSDVSGVVPVYIRNWSPTHAYVIPVTVVAGVFTEFEHTVVGGLTAAANWGSGTAGGLRFGVNFGSGVNYQAPSAGTWNAGNYVGLAGQINSVGAVNRKLAFTKMSIVLGTAKPQAEDFEVDATRMRRFYLGGIRVWWAGQTQASAHNGHTIYFPAMRITPGITVLAPAAAGPTGTPYVLNINPSCATCVSVGTGSGAYYCDMYLALSARL